MGQGAQRRRVINPAGRYRLRIINRHLLKDTY
jgi:hypothetical protein